MIIIRYLASVALYVTLLPLSSLAAFVVPAFTRAMPHKLPEGYRWGGWFGTYDNPPQGDGGFISKRAPYPNRLTGWRGYANRVQWMRRNRLYGLKRWLAVDYRVCTSRKFRGNPAINDKHRIAGWLFVTARCHSKKLQAFEWYSVTHYTKNRCLRIRLGWKIKGDKFDEAGEFGALVFTVNPFDSYGD